jgi:hypothetical protein
MLCRASLLPHLEIRSSATKSRPTSRGGTCWKRNTVRRHTLESFPWFTAQGRPVPHHQDIMGPHPDCEYLAMED